jgi:hypothetical protein
MKRVIVTYVFHACQIIFYKNKVSNLEVILLKLLHFLNSKIRNYGKNMDYNNIAHISPRIS